MAYTFPFTTAGELNLDWILEQVKAAADREDQHETNVNNQLRSFSDDLVTFMSWFPAGTFTVTRDQTTGIITNIAFNTDADTFQELLDNALGPYVTAAAAQAAIAQDAADSATATVGGNYVSFGVAQNLNPGQKETARNNIGIPNSVFQSKNLFAITTDLRILQRKSNEQAVSTFPASTTDSQGVSHDYLNISTQNASFQYNWGKSECYSEGARAIAPLAWFQAGVMIPRGTYTVSLRVTRTNTSVVWPGDWRIGVGIGYINGATTTKYQSVHTTAARGEISASSDAYADEENMSGWLRATVTIDNDVSYLGVRIQHSGAARLTGFWYDAIQVEQGAEVTEYVPYGEDMTAVDKEARAIAQEALSKVNDSVDFEPEELPEAVSNFILDGGTSELAFSWFSDQHPATGANFENNVRDDISRMVNHYKSYPSSFLVDGGDWLTSSLTAATAFEQMRKIMGISKDLLPPDAQFIHLPGNHDNNSESPSDHIIYRGAMAALYGDTTTYGVIETRNCAILCVDTGSSAISTRNQEWARNEVKWFANYLSQCRKPYVIALGHEAFRGTTGWNYMQEGNSMASITNATQALNEIAMYLMQCLSAMNQDDPYWDFPIDESRYTFQREGSDQNLHNVSHCLYWMAGHSHKQIVSQYGLVPILVTPNWALNAAPASHMRDTECWTYVVTKISDDGITTLFWLTGGQTQKPVHDGTHQQTTIDINEVSWYLNWDSNVTSASWDPYTEPT